MVHTEDIYCCIFYVAIEKYEFKSPIRSHMQTAVICRLQSYVENVKSEKVGDQLKTLLQDVDSILKGYKESDRYFHLMVQDTMMDISMGRSRIELLNHRLTNKYAGAINSIELVFSMADVE